MRLKTVHAAAAASLSAFGAAAMKKLFKEVPELSVEDGVNDGVESTVDIAEPRHHAHQGRWDVAVLTTGPQDV